MRTKYFGTKLTEQPYEREIRNLRSKYYRAKKVDNTELKAKLLREINDYQVKQAEELNL